MRAWLSLRERERGVEAPSPCIVGRMHFGGLVERARGEGVRVNTDLTNHGNAVPAGETADPFLASLGAVLGGGFALVAPEKLS